MEENLNIPADIFLELAGMKDVAPVDNENIVFNENFQKFQPVNANRLKNVSEYFLQNHRRILSEKIYIFLQNINFEENENEQPIFVKDDETIDIEDEEEEDKKGEFSLWDLWNILKWIRRIKNFFELKDFFDFLEKIKKWFEKKSPSPEKPGNSGTIRNFFDSLKQKFKNFLKTTFTKIGNFIKLDKIKVFFKKGIAKIIDFAKINKVKSFIKTKISQFKTFIKLDKIKDFWIKYSPKNLFKKIKFKISFKWNTLKFKFKTFTDKIFSIIKNKWNIIRNSIISGWKSLKGKIKNIVGRFLPKKLPFDFLKVSKNGNFITKLFGKGASAFSNFFKKIFFRIFGKAIRFLAKLIVKVLIKAGVAIAGAFIPGLGWIASAVSIGLLIMDIIDAISFIGDLVNEFGEDDKEEMTNTLNTVENNNPITKQNLISKELSIDNQITKTEKHHLENLNDVQSKTIVRDYKINDKNLNNELRNLVNNFSLNEPVNDNFRLLSSNFQLNLSNDLIDRKMFEQTNVIKNYNFENLQQKSVLTDEELSTENYNVADQDIKNVQIMQYDKESFFAEEENLENYSLVSKKQLETHMQKSKSDKWLEILNLLSTKFNYSI